MATRGFGGDGRYARCMLERAEATGDGIPGSSLPGPYPVGSYAAQLKARLRQFARVQLTGELWGMRRSRARLHDELKAIPVDVLAQTGESLAQRVGAARRAEEARASGEMARRTAENTGVGGPVQEKLGRVGSGTGPRRRGPRRRTCGSGRNRGWRRAGWRRR